MTSKVAAFPYGAPDPLACRDAVPKHSSFKPTNPQIERCPYLVEFQPFAPGEMQICEYYFKRE